MVTGTADWPGNDIFVWYHYATQTFIRSVYPRPVSKGWFKVITDDEVCSLLKAIRILVYGIYN
jgi:hypothetical protein